VREAASLAMDGPARNVGGGVPIQDRGGTVEEKLRAIYAAAELGGSEGVSFSGGAFGPGRGDSRGGRACIVPYSSPSVIKSLWEMLPREAGVVLGNFSRRWPLPGGGLAPHVEKFLDHAEPEVRAKR